MYYVDKYEEVKEWLNEWKSFWMIEVFEVIVFFESFEKKSEVVVFIEVGFMKVVECI